MTIVLLKTRKFWLSGIGIFFFLKMISENSAKNKNTLELIALEESLINPVYVEIGSEGELIID